MIVPLAGCGPFVTKLRSLLIVPSAVGAGSGVYLMGMLPSGQAGAQSFGSLGDRYQQIELGRRAGCSERRNGQSMDFPLLFRSVLQNKHHLENWVTAQVPLWADLFDQLQAIHFRHEHVGEHKIRMLAHQELEGLPAVGSREDAQAMISFE